MSTITIRFNPDLRGFLKGMRSAQRAVNQMRRNLSSMPVSRERKEVQRLGRQEMQAASRWLDRLMMQERITLGLPMCEAALGPVPKLDGQTFACALEPRHRGDHESVDGAAWSTPPAAAPTIPTHQPTEETTNG